ncbi:MAG: hypothetical protein IBJ19_19255 [Gemmatimonadaceae bacterium]|nr:hypothetical protein [Gemmatimonadaceae bacterium]
MGMGGLANHVLKGSMALVLGGARYRLHVAGGLAVLAVGLMIGLVLGWP